VVFSGLFFPLMSQNGHFFAKTPKKNLLSEAANGLFIFFTFFIPTYSLLNYCRN
jgi:hypothetical protein